MPNHISSRALRAAFLSLPAVALTACSNSTGVTPRQPVSLSFSATPTPLVARPNRVSASMFATTPAPATTVQRVQLVLSHIELERATASCASTASGSEGECESLELDPMIMDIPVGPGVKTMLSASVPAGTYNDFQATIEVVRAGDDHSAAFLATNPGFAGTSLRVTGTDANGVAFTYSSTAKAEIETAFVPALDISAANKNVTVEIDVSGWFAGIVNPGAPTAAERATIDDRIRKSLRAFEDDNKDGAPDK